MMYSAVVYIKFVLQDDDLVQSALITQPCLSFNLVDPINIEYGLIQHAPGAHQARHKRQAIEDPE